MDLFPIPLGHRGRQAGDHRCRQSVCHGKGHIDQRIVFSGKDPLHGHIFLFRIPLRGHDAVKYGQIQDLVDIVNGRAEDHRSDRQKQDLQDPPVALPLSDMVHADLPVDHRAVDQK